MQNRHSIVMAILLGGVVAGTIDVGAASAINGFVDPLRILRFIAGGLIGLPAAKAAGLQASALGFALQIGMSLIIAAIYNIGATVLPILRRHWLPAGLAFGVGVYFVMEYVVVPLSAIHSAPKFEVMSFGLNLLAMMLFGTIIAWFARAR